MNLMSQLKAGMKTRGLIKDSHAGVVTRISLKRPKQLNTLNAAMTARQISAQDFCAEWGNFTILCKPKIAAVKSPPLGGACEVRMMCDFAKAGRSRPRAGCILP